MKREANAGQTVRGRIAQNIEMARSLAATTEVRKVEAAAEALVHAYRDDHKVVLFGNGGSAADAQHIAAELVGYYRYRRPPLSALALSENSAALTAIANDTSFEEVFARQLEGVGHRGDVAMGISTSGRSPNVVAAIRAATKLGMTTVALTGSDGGEVGRLVDHWLRVDATDTARIQEGHILLGHILCELVEDALFGGAS